MFIQNIDPVLLEFGQFEIRYYGIIFALGFVAAYFFLNHLSKERKLGLSKDDVSDYLLYLIIGAVLGSRLFHIFVYEPGHYLSNPEEILAVWRGGLSIHGGVIGALLAGYIFTRKKKVDFWKLADATVIPLSFGLIFGRIANFTNSEFVGKITDVPWAVKFMQADPENFRHPVQLYEAAKNAVIFTILWTFRGHKRKDGFYFWLFVFLYSSIRFFLEFFKEWDAYYLGLSIPQLISVPLAILAGYMFFRKK